MAHVIELPLIFYIPSNNRKLEKGSLAVEVVKVSGALRCGFGYDYRRDSLPLYTDSPKLILQEFLDDTVAYAKSEKEKILKHLGKRF